MHKTAYLILNDGTKYKGISFGAVPPLPQELGSQPIAKFSGEVVFNTGMTGYHEILTDPSYTGQIVLMTYPHIGNYGTYPDWNENGPEEGRKTTDVKVSGFIARSLYTGPIPAGRITLSEFLSDNDICGISGIDTRGLTLKLRNEGSRNGIIISTDDAGLSDGDLKLCLGYLNGMPCMDGLNLIADVGTIKKEIVNKNGRTTIVLIDCGIKANIVRELVKRDCRVVLLSSKSKPEEIFAEKADAVLFSNGPGDPAVLEEQVAQIRACIGKLPVLGICLGHQLIAQALGGKTYKMKFGHHGCNQPVRDEKTGKVFVTSQNHGFAVDEKTLPEGVSVRFRNANDQTVEGLEYPDKKILCAQFHPEASPGPMDSSWIFDAFVDIAKGV